MQKIFKRPYYLIPVITFLFLLACNEKEDNKGPVLFEALDHQKTGISFANQLTARPDFNMLRYMYFYNGAGVGAGDFNNDGLIDLFFASNQGQNKLYLNKGNLQFSDATVQAGIPADGGWSTGVSVADVNDDGLLDIYVCRVGRYETLLSSNQLLICKGINENGVPFYEEQAKQYGLDFSGFSTHAAFFDYDLDGDLDMFLLNHSLRYNSTFLPRSNYENTNDSLSGDRLYRNDNGVFTDVSATAGINRSVIGYGLGVVVSDFNLDGWPDLYIGNDFHENDYLYLNNRKGGFSEELTQRVMHSSQFSMGVDAADINNDGWPDIIAADMLPSDPYILRRSLGEDEYNTFQIKIRHGYNHQYARNTLQLNRGDALFSEIGLYAGVYATDWSWATLLFDFDNDGQKDLFVSNGIPKRLNDIDYVNYVSNDEIQAKIRANKIGESDMTLIDKFPQIKLPNRFFLNKGEVAFEDVGNSVLNNQDTYSNGALYADLDNDGDLDVVVNNIDEPVLIYCNKTNDNKSKPSVRLQLQGNKGNRNAVGARVIVFSDGNLHTFEKYAARGFQSSMEIPLTIAWGNKPVDSAFLIWPDNSFQQLLLRADSAVLSFAWQNDLPQFDYTVIKKFSERKAIRFEEISRQAGLQFLHLENNFNEFDREPLMPFMVSREGPALAVADINGDGLEDVFVGAAKWEKPAVFLQQKNGLFKILVQPALEADSTYEDVDACWTDVNNDGFPDLLVASGGNEYYGDTKWLIPRLYINDGKGNLSKNENAFPMMVVSASVVASADVNGDGYMDFFIGGRALPWDYGTIPPSYLFLNDGKGNFTDAAATLAPDLSAVGFVKHAVWADADNDGDKDLVLALEWDGICAFINDKGKFSKQYLAPQKGWWNFILPVDIDNDGDLDFIAGNQGWNSRFHATAQQPVRFYYHDFDGNGKKEQVLSYYIDDREIPFANKADLEKQMPSLKKRFLYAEDFAKASIKEVFEPGKLKAAAQFSADYFANAVLMNEGNLQFSLHPLPWQAQLTSYKDAAVADVDGDTFPDIILGGNFYPYNIQMGRYDADYGSVLINNGNGNFRHEQLNGLTVKGEIRRIRSIQLAAGNEGWLLGRNNDSLLLIRTKN